jgi:hypothetical protein
MSDIWSVDDGTFSIASCDGVTSTNFIWLHNKAGTRTCAWRTAAGVTSTLFRKENVSADDGVAEYVLVLSTDVLYDRSETSVLTPGISASTQISSPKKKPLVSSKTAEASQSTVLPYLPRSLPEMEPWVYS